MLTLDKELDFNLFMKQDREKIPKQHLGDTVEELKRFNARRKLKGAVQAIAGGLANDPLCGTDTDSGNYQIALKKGNSNPLLAQIKEIEKHFLN